MNEPTQEVKEILKNSLKWEQALIACDFCGEQFLVDKNEYRCPACGMRGYLRERPQVLLDGSVK